MICCQVAREGQDPEGAVVLLNNNRDGSFEDIAERCGFSRVSFSPSEAMFADVDQDLDQDLLLWDGAGGKLHLYRNDRTWRYRHLPPGEDSPRLVDVSHVAIRTTGLDVRMVLTAYRDGGLVEDYLIGPDGSLTKRIGLRRAYACDPLIARGHEVVLSIP